MREKLLHSLKALSYIICELIAISGFSQHANLISLHVSKRPLAPVFGEESVRMLNQTDAASRVSL